MTRMLKTVAAALVVLAMNSPSWAATSGKAKVAPNKVVVKRVAAHKSAQAGKKAHQGSHQRIQLKHVKKTQHSAAKHGAKLAG